LSSPYTSRVIKDLEDSREVFTRALAEPDFVASVARAAEVVNDALRAGRKILLAGNGGSAADAQHLATELMVRFRVDRAPLAAIALTTDTSALTAIGNDLGFEQLFARQVQALGQAGDVFMGFSTSGRSPNVVAACKTARERGLTVIGFTGSKGRVMDEFCHLLIHVPSDVTALIQQVHIAAGHIVCGIVEDELVAGAKAT
jgi:D-sedoheptulose 7-phosphate isomerase